MPGRGTVRIVVAGAPPPSKTIERVETELGWEFIQIYGLTETAPAADHQPGAGGVGRAGRRRAVAAARAGPACRPSACGSSVDADGEVLARSNHVFAGYWEQPRRDGRGARRRVVPHRRRRLPRRGLRGDLGPQEGRHHHRGRERVVHRGRGLPLPARRRGRGGRDRRARREVGRDDQGARRGARGARGQRGRAHRALPGPAGPLQGADQRRAPRRAGPHRDGQAAEVQAAPALLGRAGAAVN